MTLPVRILVVDDHTLFRRGLTALLMAQPRFDVVGEAGDAGEAHRRAADLQPDLILLDNHLPGVQGVDAIQGLREVAPRARILMLTVSEDGATLARALQRGASGYLLKTVDSDVLASAIERAMQGQSTISPEMTGKLVSAFQALQGGPAADAPAPSTDPAQTLSPREQQILAEIARGASNKEIAQALGIAPHTVKNHMALIFEKLGASNRAQAVSMASKHNEV